MGMCILGFNGVAVHKDLPDDKIIYRFIKVKHLDEIINKKEVFLNKVINWEDTWEFPSRYVKEFKRENTFYNKAEFLAQNCDIVSKYLFGSSFTDNFDTDAMWRIYSKISTPDHEVNINDKTVCISTTVKSLALSICGVDNNIFLGPVVYVDLGEMGFSDTFSLDEASYFPGFLYQAYIKRKAFEHEKEIRLVAFDYLAKDNKRIPLSSLDFIKEIIIDPRSREHELIDFKKKYKSLDIIVRKSTLYDSPEFDIKKIKEIEEDYMFNSRKFLNTSRRFFNQKG